MHASKNSTTSQLRNAIAQEMLTPVCEALSPSKKLCFIIDTPNCDAEFLEDDFLKQIRSRLGKPYCVDFAQIGPRITFAQTLFALIFLRSLFPLDLIKSRKTGTEENILRIFIEKKEDPSSRIAQRFLECRRLTVNERRRLGVDHDLSNTKNAVKFFAGCVKSFNESFNKVPVFYFRNPKIDKDTLRSVTTNIFITEVQSRIRAIFIMIIPKNAEYLLLPIEDTCAIIRLPALNSDILKDTVLRVWKTSCFDRKLSFSEDGLREFCSVMRHIYGKTVSALALAKALTDIAGHAILEGSERISAESIRRLFSDDVVKVKPPVPRRPRTSILPYFGSEIERLTRECEIRGLDPHYAIPWDFRNVLRYISSGFLRYSADDDTFETLRYVDRNRWKELNASLRSMGYRYVGQGKWVFSPD